MACRSSTSPRLPNPKPNPNPNPNPNPIPNPNPKPNHNPGPNQELDLTTAGMVAEDVDRLEKQLRGEQATRQAPTPTPTTSP